jgi:hypothetical protein
MHRIGSNWLDDVSDKEMIRRSVGRGLGEILVGPTQIEKLEALCETPVRCSLGHVFKLADSSIPDSGNCPHVVCKGKRNPLMLAGGVPLEGLDDEKQDETVPGYSRMVKSDDIPTGGTINHRDGGGNRPLYTSKSRVRTPWTGTR